MKQPSPRKTREGFLFVRCRQTKEEDENISRSSPFATNAEEAERSKLQRGMTGHGKS